MSKNKFEIHGDRISISHPDWDFIASASIRDDYAEELQSVTWSKNGEYLYSNKLEIYLHIYIVRKWYGDNTYDIMKDEGYVVDEYSCAMKSHFRKFGNQMFGSGNHLCEFTRVMLYPSHIPHALIYHVQHQCS